MDYKFLINKSDLFLIVSNAKDKIFHLNPPLFISQKEVSHGELPSLAMIESILMFLNSKGLLKQMVEIDYTYHYDDNDTSELTEKITKV